MKISVISDRAGKIVGASFSPATGRSAAGPRVTDQIQIPDGHRVHQLALPPELAEEFLSGNFAQALSKCTLEIKGKSAKLKPAVSKKLATRLYSPQGSKSPRHGTAGANFSPTLSIKKSTARPRNARARYG